MPILERVTRIFKEPAGRFDAVADWLARPCSSVAHAPCGFSRRRRIRMRGTRRWRSWGNISFARTARFAMGWAQEAEGAAQT